MSDTTQLTSTEKANLDLAHEYTCALFRVEDDKLVEFVKEWNKLPMWQQLGWPIEEGLTYHE